VLLSTPHTVVDLLVGHGPGTGNDYSHCIQRADADRKRDPNDVCSSLLVPLLCERVVAERGLAKKSVNRLNLWAPKPSLLQKTELAAIADALIDNRDTKGAQVLLGAIEVVDISADTLADLIRIIGLLDFDEVESR
jgi:hypothetical protein